MTGRSFAIIPAAGRSQRMGRPKLLLPWGESTVIETVLAAWQAGGVDQRIVVAHADDHELCERAERAGAVVVVPDVPPPQMRDSVLAALAFIGQHFHPTAADVWLLAPADLPHLSAAAIRVLLAAHRPDDTDILTPVTSDGRRGHPVLFPWSVASAVAALSADQGVNALLSGHPVRTVLCPDLPPEADLDTPADYARLSGNRAW